MAHTCGLCCGGLRRITAPTLNDGMEMLKPAPRTNPNYSHDWKSWKSHTKARKQYLRRAGR